MRDRELEPDEWLDDPVAEDELQAMERAYDRFLDGDSLRDVDVRNGVSVGSRLSLVEYYDDEGRD